MKSNSTSYGQQFKCTLASNLQTNRNKSRDFYCYAERRTVSPIGDYEYKCLTKQKCKKLSKLCGKYIHTTTLNGLPLKHLCRFNKPNTIALIYSNVINLSTTPLSTETLETISLSLNYVPFPRKFPRTELITSIKYAAVESLKDVNAADRKLIIDLINRNVIKPYVTIPSNIYEGFNTKSSFWNVVKQLK
ncbi:hypothetical protein GJ496_007925 [Pomphorhynchus laevis]|nr:hypothetical protein GJ496_007925 [Pomphorhynchus laevis]